MGGWAEGLLCAYPNRRQQKFNNIGLAKISKVAYLFQCRKNNKLQFEIFQEGFEQIIFAALKLNFAICDKSKEWNKSKEILYLQKH